MKKKFIVAGSLAFVVFILDFYTKNWALQNLEQYSVRPVIEGFFNLTLVFNRGVAFGMFSSLPDWLRVSSLALTGLLAFAVLFWIFKRYAQQSGWVPLGVGLILGGALGNVLDRFRHGAVVDFLDFYWGNWHWPAFNVADCGICVGVFVLILVCKD